MRSPTTPIVLTALLLAALPVVATAQQEDDQAFLRVPVPEEGEDRIHRLRTQVRHTTVIVLPADENILDFVVGDSEYWHLTGAANVAFLKPLSADAATNIALVCESGRIYSFLVAEQSDGPPHLVVRVESGAEAARLSGGSGRPAFVARSEVAAYQQMAAEAAEAARSAREAAEAGILEARTQAESAIEEFRARYPERLAFEYRLDGDAADRPFLVEAMWHDGQFTYLRSHAQESPALYELRDGEPALVATTSREDGLYIARHCLAASGADWMAPDRRQAGQPVHAAGKRLRSRWKQWVSATGRRAAGRHRDEGGRGVDRRARRWTPLLVGDDGSQEDATALAARGPSRRRRDGPFAPEPHSARGRAADPGGRRPGARRARAPAGRGRRRDGSAPDRVGDAEHRSRDPRRERGRVGASGGASAGGAGAKNPLAPRPSRGSVVQGVRTRPRSRPKPAPAIRPTRMWPSSRTRSKRRSPLSSSRSGRSRRSWKPKSGCSRLLGAPGIPLPTRELPHRSKLSSPPRHG